MYFFPGYVKHYEENDAVYILSTLLENKVELSDPSIQNEFRTLVKSGGCQEISTSLTEFLHEQELLLNEEELRSTLERVRGYLNSTMILTIMPTEGCNFRCPYCYEDHKATSMTRATLDRIQDYIIKQAPNFKIVRINWFGGEPTLCKDVILETNQMVQNLQAGYKFQFISGMTTNGYLLTEEYFREFYAAGITDYQITLDGWLHDKTRPHVNGQGTLQTIMDNLKTLSTLPKEEFPFRITLRRNSLDSDTDLTWYDHLYKLFGNDGRFYALVTPVGNWGGEEVKTLDLLKKGDTIKRRKLHEAYLDQIGMPRYGRENSTFQDICYASYPYGLVFRANGKIEKCTIRPDHPKNQVGYVDPDAGIILDDAANQLWAVNDLKPECGVCSEVPKCLNLACREPSIIRGEPEGHCTNFALLTGK